MGEGLGLDKQIQAFIERWRDSGASERANYQMFLRELCELLGVDFPEPSQADESRNAYVFERTVRFDHGDGTSSTGRIDLYKRGCFVCEAKQGSDPAEQAELFGEPAPSRRGTAVRRTKGWDQAMVRARNQAYNYARALPREEGWPPFLMTVDVGHAIELWADFSGMGKTYAAYPDPTSHRIYLDDLLKPEIRERLAKVWTDPAALDPARYAAKVTREVAAKLAELAKSLEQSGRAPESVAQFLMRCLFTMFAEDVELLPKNTFTELLERQREHLDGFAPTLKRLWEDMNHGAYSVSLQSQLLQFNGSLFASPEAIPLTAPQLELLIEAAKAEWSSVEPAIFGTLLERALDPAERHKLGAHYTPRAYVERLVMPTIVEPLRDEWATVQATATNLVRKGEVETAVKALRDFHRRLCNLHILDPACGSGNFLYVALEHLKRLEGEVIDLIAGIDEGQAALELRGHTVTPEQFLGIEINPRAATIAEMVLWIGFLQWHFRTSKKARPPVPVLKKYGNIEWRDAVLAYDATHIRKDDKGKVITHWDGRTYKRHPVTGEEVPDESAQIEDYEYVNPRPAEWPNADFVIGNPPFVGTKRMRFELGHGYTEALRSAYPEVPQSADFVMYWWWQASEKARKAKIARFGFITTNSINQNFNRRVLERAFSASPPLSLAFAIPDHPWSGAPGSAAVRIAMTVGRSGNGNGKLQRVITERETGRDAIDVTLVEDIGQIGSSLRIGPDISSAVPLKATAWISGMGVALHGSGFILNSDRATALRKHGRRVIRPYVGGADLLQVRRDRYLIDFSGLSEKEAKEANPVAFQHVIDYVKPERDHNRRQSIQKLWWRFGWERPLVRTAIKNLKRYIGTTETARHRIFQFIPANVLPDHMIIVIASSDSHILGVLSSRPHVTWAVAVGGRLGKGPRYNKNVCFSPFPFPDASEEQKDRIRKLAEQLDEHRKARQVEHPDLTMTQMYNLLEALREGRTLTAKEKEIHEKGLVSVLKNIHDELDEAVLDTYGWPHDIADEEIVARIVALNKERAAEEARGIVRWLRPEYQRPRAEKRPAQVEMEVPEAAVAVKPQAWPTELPAQVQAIRDTLAARRTPLSAEEVARQFRRANRARVAEVLTTLAALGQARKIDGDRFLPGA